MRLDLVSLKLELKDLKKEPRKFTKRTKLNTNQVRELLIQYKKNTLTINELLDWNFELSGIRISRPTFYRLLKSFSNIEVEENK